MLTWVVDPPSPVRAARAWAAMSFEGATDAASIARGWDRLVGVARRLGARVVVGTAENGVPLPYGWNGSVLRIKPDDDPRKRLADLAHDLGHLQCARPDRRGLVEFGLGPGYATDGPVAPEDIRAVRRAGVLEDHVACVLAAYWTRAVGVSAIAESRAIFTIAPHSRDWTSDAARETCAGALHLAEHWGLIDPEADTPLERVRRVIDDPVLARLRFVPQWCRDYPGAHDDSAAGQESTASPVSSKNCESDRAAPMP